MNSTTRYQASSPGSLFFDYSHQPDLLLLAARAGADAVRTTGFQAANLEFSSAPNVALVVCEYDEPSDRHDQPELRADARPASLRDRRR